MRDEEGILEYVNGEVCVWPDIDLDMLNMFTIEYLCKQHNNYRLEKKWWLTPRTELEFGLRELSQDDDIMNMFKASRRNNGEIEIFYEHPIDVDKEDEVIMEEGRKKAEEGDQSIGKEKKDEKGRNVRKRPMDQEQFTISIGKGKKRNCKASW